jgi:hypothetical protein
VGGRAHIGAAQCLLCLYDVRTHASNKRLDLTPIAITRPAGDDQPDTEDGSAFDVWLRSQLGQ